MQHDETRPFGFWTACAMVVGGVIGAGIFIVWRERQLGIERRKARAASTLQ